MTHMLQFYIWMETRVWLKQQTIGCTLSMEEKALWKMYLNNPLLNWFYMKEYACWIMLNRHMSNHRSNYMLTFALFNYVISFYTYFFISSWVFQGIIKGTETYHVNFIKTYIRITFFCFTNNKLMNDNHFKSC